MYDIDITSLLKPIRNDQPCGIDRLSDSKVDAEHTIIKDARRSDDQSLPLGPYQKAFKTADWHKVKKLSIDFLANSSKEIEVVGWLLEALIYLYHLEGLHQGLRLLDSMLNLFWSDIYPLDEEIRATQLRLIQKSLSNAVRKLPLTSTVTGSLNWHDWSEYNNLSKSNYQKLDMDQHAKIASFIDNIHNTPFDFYTKFSSNLEEVSQAIATLQATLISRFKNEAPPTITDFHMAIADIGNGIDDVLKQQKNRVQAYGSQDAMAEELQQIKVLESVSDETQNFVTISNESPVLNQNQIPVLKAVDHESDVSTNQFGPQSSSESFDSDGDETSNPTSGSVFQRSD